MSYEYRTEQFADIAGFTRLKAWLDERRGAFAKDSVGDAPKGILLLGVQGSGKSLAAKAVAGRWRVPLLRLDIAALYNKFVGETERNLRDALRQAEIMAPCVLWLDEIEKGIAADNSDEGISRRMLGTLLTWMAERTAPVFVVATSNDIRKLPPELIRKGRLDEIFFVDLPAAAVRQDIFAIHLRKRHIVVEDLDLERLALLTEGFSGAEIEQVVVSALYGAAAREQAVTIEHLIIEIENTRPLSVVMAEQITALRAWAGERTIFVD